MKYFEASKRILKQSQTENCYLLISEWRKSGITARVVNEKPVSALMGATKTASFVLESEDAKISKIILLVCLFQTFASRDLKRFLSLSLLINSLIDWNSLAHSLAHLETFEPENFNWISPSRIASTCSTNPQTSSATRTCLLIIP